VARVTGPDGVLLVAKRAGITSHDVVERVRRSSAAGGRRVGHAGTLDPFATGLLLVLVGRATRTQRVFMELPKTYRAVARFGAESDTGDPTGRVTPAGSIPARADVVGATGKLLGEVSQQVPMTSAVKVGGERLYAKARRGEVVETPVRTVRIARLELVSYDDHEGIAELEVECSSGTYVRQLVADLGRLAGSAAFCQALERNAIGPFTLDRADEEKLLPLNEALGFLPERRLTADEAHRVRNGVAVPAERPSDARVRLTFEDELVALAERRDDAYKPVTVLES
jgi:tRNA pseudouridine55 synthase